MAQDKIGRQGVRRDLESYGLPLPEAWEAEVNVLMLRYHRAALAVKRAMFELRESRWNGELLRIVRDIESSAPYALCPVCKGLPVDPCECDGARWVSKSFYDLLDACDPKAVDHEEPIVRVNGVWVDYHVAKEAL